jgi:alpha-mannosidase
VAESGPLRATLLVRREVLSSVVEQRISVYRSIPRVDFATRIDWHDAHVLLKVAFPLDVRVRQATSEMQFGAVERPTHRNTSWDQARFETCAHRWVDLSEAGYGVSLLNDGRYGHDVRDSTIRLTLLRSPTAPDPQADQGLHEVTYALFPHMGDWREGGTVSAAYALNRPLRIVGLDGVSNPSASGRADQALFAADPANVVIEAVKRPAEGEGVMLRVYEAHGARVRARLRSTLAIRDVVECDLLERRLDGNSPAFPAWNASPYASHDTPTREDHAWSFELRPWEVRTFRVSI